MSENFTQFEDFSRIVEEFATMRGSIGLYTELGKKGSLINLNDLIYTSRGIYHILPDKTLKKIILYQAERHFRHTEKQEDTNDPTFHIYKCDIVKNHIEHKSKKFKITTRKDGNFLVKDYKFDENMRRKEETHYKKLLICNLCFIMFNRISRTNILKEDFKVRDYLEPGYSELTFTYNFDEIPIGYKSNWQEIAVSLKEKKGYVCEKCKIKIENLYAEKFLNVHFTTEKLYTKFTDKAEVLCLGCHSKEPGHEHIKDRSEYKHFCDFVSKKG